MPAHLLYNRIQTEVPKTKQIGQVKDMKKAITSFTLDYILTAVAFILIGILFLADPSASGKIVCYILGGILCAIGVVHTVSYFTTPVQMPQYNLSLVRAIIFIGLGVFILAKPGKVMDVLPVIMGVAILIDSLIKLQNAIDMLRIRQNSWLYTLIVAVVLAILGSVMVAKPTIGYQFIGIVFIINGAIDIAALLILKNRVNAAAQSAQQG